MEALGVGTAAQGILLVKTSAQLQREEEQRLEDEQRKQGAAPVTNLAGHIDAAWRRNRDHRNNSGATDLILQCLRQRNNKYDPQVKAKIEAQGETVVFAGITDIKCCAAEAWVKDTLLSPIEKPWSLKPTPLPDLPEEVIETIVNVTMTAWRQQIEQTGQGFSPDEVEEMAADLREETVLELRREAVDRAKGMERLIHDQMTEGKWSEAFSAIIYDIVTFPTATLKGPILRKQKKLEWVRRRGRSRPVVRAVEREIFYRVHPLDCYPAPNAGSPQEGDFIERMRLDRKTLSAMRSEKGYSRDAIDLVLRDYGESGYRFVESADTERAEAQKTESPHREGTGSDNMIEALDYWGSCSARKLLDWQLAGVDYTDLNREYEVHGVKAGAHVIFVELNADPLGDRPYSTASYESVTGSYWGRGVPQKMRDLQRVCNAAFRALVRNLGIAAGPQIVITDTNRLEPGENPKEAYPMKVWLFRNPANMTAPPVDFFTPDSRATELLTVFDHFNKLADDITGIPAYSYGSDRVAGAGRTYHGLSLLMSSASRGLREVILRIDQSVIQQTVHRLWVLNMLYADDEAVKGDIEILPVGALNAIVQEQMAQRRQAFMQLTANPIDQEIIGLKGRATLLRQEAQDMNIPAGDVVPSEEEIEAKEVALKAQAALFAAEQQTGQPAKAA